MDMLFEFFVWWYGAGWLGAGGRIKNRVLGIWRMFSVGILLRTLFAPWRRITSNAGKGLDQFFMSLIDNFVSRMVGFTVRVFVLFSAVIIMSFAIVVGLLFVAAWPLLPVVVVICLIKGVVG